MCMAIIAAAETMWKMTMTRMKWHFLPYSVDNKLVLILMCIASNVAHAHGGGLNSEGCHNNRKTGGYHCHRAPVTRQPVALAATSRPPAASGDGYRTVKSAPVARAPGRPQCFTGPRGGTYTITASGRKNYSGC